MTPKNSLMLQTLGSRLRTVRRYRDVTLEDLGRQVQVSRQHLSRIENGLCYPSVDLVVRIAEVLKCEVLITFKLNEYINADTQNLST